MCIWGPHRLARVRLWLAELRHELTGLSTWWPERNKPETSVGALTLQNVSLDKRHPDTLPMRAVV